MDVIDPNYAGGNARADRILGAMNRRTPTEFAGHSAKYLFDRADGKLRMVVRAR
jgi:hypothetical protein